MLLPRHSPTIAQTWRVLFLCGISTSYVMPGRVPGIQGRFTHAVMAVKKGSSGLYPSRGTSYRRKDIVYPSGTFWRGILPRHSCLGRGLKPRRNIPERDTIPFRHFISIRLRSSLLVSITAHQKHLIPGPWIAGTGPGNDVLLCFINELNNKPPSSWKVFFLRSI